MIWFVAITCSLVWLLGLLTSHTMNGFLHVLAAVAVVLVVVRVVRGRLSSRPRPRRGSFEAYQRRK